MKDQVLSISQMEELETLGIDISKASLYWAVNVLNCRGRKEDLMPPFLTFYQTGQVVGHASFKYVPTFTLQDILGMLPKNLFIDPETESGRDYHLGTNLIDSFYYTTGYDEDAPLVMITEDNLINAAFGMLKYLKKNVFV